MPQLTGTVHERIHQLESLVISLMRQGETIPEPAGSVSTSNPTNSSSQIARSEESRLQSSLLSSFSDTTSSTSGTSAINVEGPVNATPVPLGGGYMKYNNIGTTNYVGSSHWAAVLNSISELKGTIEQDDESRNMATDFHPHNYHHYSSPRLLYGCQWATKTEILSSIPPRRATDRLVSRYMTLDIASGRSPVSKLKIEHLLN